MSIVINIADAVVADLNGTELSQPFTAQRVYVPSFNLEEMTELKVSVAPRELDVTNLSRGRSQFDAQIDVAVQKKFSTGDATEIDPLMTLVEEIGDLFRLHRLHSFPNAIWIGTEHRQLYSPEHWEQLTQFTSLMTLSFRVGR